MSDFIPVANPQFFEDDARAVYDVVNSGWVSMGKKVQEFERDFHRYMEGAHSAMLNKIMETTDLDDATQEELGKAIEGFKATTSY